MREIAIYVFQVLKRALSNAFDPLKLKNEAFMTIGCKSSLVKLHCLCISLHLGQHNSNVRLI